MKGETWREAIFRCLQCACPQLMPSLTATADPESMLTTDAKLVLTADPVPELIPATNQEPEKMPTMKPKPAASSVPELKPAAQSDQVCEPVATSVQVEDLVEQDDDYPPPLIPVSTMSISLMVAPSSESSSLPPVSSPSIKPISLPILLILLYSHYCNSEIFLGWVGGFLLFCHMPVKVHMLVWFHQVPVPVQVPVNEQGKSVNSLICSYNFSLSHSSSNALAAKSTRDSNGLNLNGLRPLIGSKEQETHN